MEYKFNFDWWKIEVSNLKEKELNRLVHIINNSRHVADVSFAGTGTLSFEDEDHYHVIVNPLETFNRVKSNVAIFNIHPESGYDLFDKMFVYYSKGKRVNNWGIVMFNTKTKEQRHLYFINDDLFDIVMHINRQLNKLSWKDDGKCKEVKQVGIETTEYVGRDGLLLLNDHTCKVYPDLPIVEGRSRAFYREGRVLNI